VSRGSDALADRPAVSDVLQQGFGTGAQTRDVVAGLIGRPAIAAALAAHGDDRGAAWPLLHQPLRRWHGLQGPGDVSAAFHLPFAGAPGDSPAVGQLVSDQSKPLVPPARWPAARSAAAVFNGVPLRGRVAFPGRRRSGRNVASAGELLKSVSSSIYQCGKRMPRRIRQSGSALRNLIRSPAAAGLVAGSEANAQVRFPRTRP